MRTERIVALRKEKKWRQSDLAKRINVSSQVVSNWERKYTTPNADDIQKLADALECSVDYLLGRTDERYGSVDLSEFTEEEVEEYENLIADLKDGIQMEQLIRKYAVRLEGKLITPEEWQGMIAWLKIYRNMQSP